MRILVTGAEGYIGRHLLPKLQEAGHEVLGIKRSHIDPDSPGIRDFLNIFSPEPGFQYDLADPDFSASLAKVLDGAPPDVVIHLAGRVEISLLPNPKGADLPPVPGPCDIARLYRDNVVATANVLDYCLKAGVKHLIFASTQAVYGWPEEHPEGGWLVPNPLDHYAASKLAAEQLLEVGERQGLLATILRIPGVYGGDRTTGLVRRLAESAIREGCVKVDTTCPMPMDVIHIEDVVSAFLAALHVKRNLGPLDVTTGERCSVERIAADIAHLFDGRYPSSTLEEKVVLKLDPEPARLAMGWKAKPRKERLAQVLEEIRRGS